MKEIVKADCERILEGYITSSGISINKEETFIFKTNISSETGSNLIIKKAVLAILAEKL